MYASVDDFRTLLRCTLTAVQTTPSDVQTTWIPYSKPYRAPHEVEYLEQVLSSGWTHGDGPFTRRAGELLTGITASASSRC